MLDEVHAGLCVVKQAARKSLHGDEAHVRLFTAARQVYFLGRADIAKGELHRFKQAAVYAALGKLEPVIGYAYVANVALFLGFKRGGIGAVFIVRDGHGGRIMELEQVYIIRFQHTQAVFNMGRNGGLVLPAGLGGNDYIVPNVAERKPKLHLAVCIHVGGVKVIDAAIVSLSQQLYRVLNAAPLHGQRAERAGGDHQFCASKTNFIHASSVNKNLPCNI